MATPTTPPRDDIMDILERLYNDDHLEQLYVRTVGGDNYEDYKMTGHKMTTKNDLMAHGYDEHYERTIKTVTEVLKPRTFHSELEIRAYMKHIERLAGRTLEDDEWGILLRTITNGRQYELVCKVDISDDLKGIPRYVRVA